MKEALRDFLKDLPVEEIEKSSAKKLLNSLIKSQQVSQMMLKCHTKFRQLLTRNEVI